MSAAGADADRVLVEHPSGARAEIHLQGAHVTSWRTADGTERLFLSSASRFEPGVAIRGGIPIIFPQFADRGPLPKHGFARTVTWRLLRTEGARATFGLSDSPATRALWPVAFEAELRVGLERDGLEVALAVKLGDRARFTAALHSYLRVSDVGRAVVRGLRGASYDSRAEGSEGGVQESDDVRIAGELDRVYLDVAGPLTLEDGPARLTLTQRGFTDVVLWNPGEAKAGQLNDLGPDEYRNMLCVEAASVGTAVAPGPGEQWMGLQRIQVVR